MHKDFNQVQTYVEMIKNLNERNISYSFNFVLGGDTDDLEVLSTTLEFVQKHKVPAAYFNLLAPLRGTPFYDRMKADGAVLDEPNLERWAGVHCHFHPKLMTREQLMDGIKRMQREMYSWSSMFRRLRFPPRSLADFASWNVNLTQRRVAYRSHYMNEFSEF